MPSTVSAPFTSPLTGPEEKPLDEKYSAFFLKTNLDQGRDQALEEKENVLRSMNAVATGTTSSLVNQQGVENIPATGDTFKKHSKKRGLDTFKEDADHILNTPEYDKATKSQLLQLSFNENIKGADTKTLRAFVQTINDQSLSSTNTEGKLLKDYISDNLKEYQDYLDSIALSSAGAQIEGLSPLFKTGEGVEPPAAADYVAGALMPLTFGHELVQVMQEVMPGKKYSWKDVLLPGDARVEFRNALKELPPEMQTQYRKRLSDAISKSTYAGFENDFIKWDMAVSLLDEEDPSTFETALDNVFGVIDVLAAAIPVVGGTASTTGRGIKSGLRTLLKATKGKDARSVMDRIEEMSRGRIAENSAFAIASTLDPHAAEEVLINALKDSSDRLAKGLGVTKEGLTVETMFPKMDESKRTPGVGLNFGYYTSNFTDTEKINAMKQSIGTVEDVVEEVRKATDVGTVLPNNVFIGYKDGNISMEYHVTHNSYMGFNTYDQAKAIADSYANRLGRSEADDFKVEIHARDMSANEYKKVEELPPEQGGIGDYRIVIKTGDTLSGRNAMPQSFHKDGKVYGNWTRFFDKSVWMQDWANIATAQADDRASGFVKQLRETIKPLSSLKLRDQREVIKLIDEGDEIGHWFKPDELLERWGNHPRFEELAEGYYAFKQHQSMQKALIDFGARKRMQSEGIKEFFFPTTRVLPNNTGLDSDIQNVEVPFGAKGNLGAPKVSGSTQLASEAEFIPAGVKRVYDAETDSIREISDRERKAISEGTLKAYKFMSERHSGKQGFQFMIAAPDTKKFQASSLPQRVTRDWPGYVTRAYDAAYLIRLKIEHFKDTGEQTFRHVVLGIERNKKDADVLLEEVKASWKAKKLADNAEKLKNDEAKVTGRLTRYKNRLDKAAAREQERLRRSYAHKLKKHQKAINKEKAEVTRGIYKEWYDRGAVNDSKASEPTKLFQDSIDNISSPVTASLDNLAFIIEMPQNSAVSKITNAKASVTSITDKRAQKIADEEAAEDLKTIKELEQVRHTEDLMFIVDRKQEITGLDNQATAIEKLLDLGMVGHNATVNLADWKAIKELVLKATDPKAANDAVELLRKNADSIKNDFNKFFEEIKKFESTLNARKKVDRQYKKDINNILNNVVSIKFGKASNPIKRPAATGELPFDLQQKMALMHQEVEAKYTNQHPLKNVPQIDPEARLQKKAEEAKAKQDKQQKEFMEQLEKDLKENFSRDYADEIDITTGQKIFDPNSWEYMEANGQLYTSPRRLDELKGRGGRRVLKSLPDTLEQSRRTAARMATLDLTIDKLVRNFEQLYGDEFGKFPWLGPMRMPDNLNPDKRKDFHKAVSQANYIKMLAGVDEDWLAKLQNNLMIFASEGILNFSLNGWENRIADSLMSNRKFNVVDKVKSIAFFQLITTRPFRQAVLQANQMSLYLGRKDYGDYFFSGKGMTEFATMWAGMVAKSTNNHEKTWAGLAKSAGMSEAAYKELIDAYVKTGLPASIDSHVWTMDSNLPRNLYRISEGAEDPGKLKDAYDTAANKLNFSHKWLRRMGFDLGEQTQLLMAFLAEKHAWQVKHGDEFGVLWKQEDALTEIAGRARMLSGNMNQAGALGFQKSISGALFQFLSHTTKMAQLILPQQIPDGKIGKKLFKSYAGKKIPGVSAIAGEAIKESDKWRILGTQALIYGTGGTGLTGAYEAIRDEVVEGEVPDAVNTVIEEGLFGAMVNGMLNLVYDDSIDLEISKSLSPLGGAIGLNVNNPLTKVLDLLMNSNAGVQDWAGAGYQVLNRMIGDEFFGTFWSIMNDTEYLSVPERMGASLIALFNAGILETDAWARARYESTVQNYISQYGNLGTHANNVEILSKLLLGVRTRDSREYQELKTELTGIAGDPKIAPNEDFDRITNYALNDFKAMKDAIVLLDKDVTRADFRVMQETRAQVRALTLTDREYREYKKHFRKQLYSWMKDTQVDRRSGYLRGGSEFEVINHLVRNHRGMAQDPLEEMIVRLKNMDEWPQKEQLIQRMERAIQ